jgi:hypothetical protein
MQIKKVTTSEVKVSFMPGELEKIRSMSKLANQTDFMSTDDYIRIHLRHAQDQLDNFPECVPDGK